MTSEEPESQPYEDWYIAANGDIEQGDLFNDVTVMKPGYKDGKYVYASKSARVVVLTQSCDVRKVDCLLVAEVHDYDTLAVRTNDSHLRSKDFRKALARGRAVSDFLLPPHQAFGLSWSLAAFHDVYLVPKALLLDDTADRFGRLASPYVEYLAQTYGMFMMRVGLPTTLSDFEGHQPPTAGRS